MKKVIVYGSGSSAESFVSKYANTHHIVGISDRTPQQTKGFPFIPSDQLLHTECDWIVVASWAIDAITERLLRLGIPGQRLVWFQHNRNSLVPWQEFRNAQQHLHLQSAEVLYAFYDLDIARATFDILNFVCVADKKRRDLHLKSLHLVIVCATNNQFNLAGRVNLSVREHDWRIRHILLPCCALVPAFSGVSMTSTKAEAEALLQHSQHVFPEDYTVAKPTERWEFNRVFECSTVPSDIATLDAPVEAKTMVQQWLARLPVNGRRIVTITVRQNSMKPGRNSNLDAWREFVAGLDNSRYLPVVIPDTETMGVSGFAAEVFVAASLNVEVRMALYLAAHVNLGVSNGPMSLCMLSHQCRYILFKIVNEEYTYASTEVLLSKGFTIGADLPIATPWQKLVWQEDTADVIQQAFLNFEANIDEQH